MLPKKRSMRIFFSRAGSFSRSGLSDSRYSTPSRASSIMPEAVGDGGAVVVAAVGGVEGDGRVGVGRLQALEDLLLGQPEVLGQLGHGGGAAVLLRQVAGGLGQAELELLQPARNPDGPALVAEVPLDLADDGRRGVGGELDGALEVEAVDGLDQPDGRDLHEVIERLAAVAEPPGQVLHQREVGLDEVIAQPRPAGVTLRQAPELDEHRAGLGPVGGRALGAGADGGQVLHGLDRCGDVGVRLDVGAVVA